MRRGLSPLILTLVLIGALSGCATAGSGAAVDETLDVYGAKAVAQSMENELASYVPTSSVASTEQLDKGILLSCGADGIYQWTGHNYLTLSGPVDDRELVDEIAQAFARRPSFAARLEMTPDGAPRARVVGPAGSSYSLTTSVDRSRIEIFSFSPCFRLPDDMSRRADY
ncbi:hypothetical protein SAMN04487788_0696 [Microbacterium testaceum StLB037]|uniref:Uncharacterized protein n=1 Tax=Microbacterium testaceum (strain StLB037) TaxID=979556 RepID=A0A1H0M2V8_MICTS|nr:hypothetical protein SAMN04487788_0696 [Microbacterium testaceum StLB037]